MGTVENFKCLFLVFIIVVIVKIIISSGSLKLFNEIFEYGSGASISRNLDLPAKKHERYLIYECVHNHFMCGGWADRLKGIFSTYAWALLTNRKFLINITEPCYIQSVLHPNRVKWNDEIVDYKNLSVKEYYFYYDYVQMNEFLRQNISRYFGNYDVIKVRTSIPFVNSLGENPTVKNKIRELGFDEKKFKLPYLVKKFYDDLFLLSPKLKIKYNSLLNQLGKNTKLICAQLRFGGSTSKSNHDTYFADRKSSKLYWDFIKENFIKKLDKENQKYKIFVTSDHESSAREAEEVFGKSKIIYNYNSSVHMAIDVGSKKNDCSDIEGVLIDFHFLQNCNMAVISHSGFGFIGLWNRKIPNENLYVYGKKDLKKGYWNRANLTIYKLDNIDELTFL